MWLGVMVTADHLTSRQAETGGLQRVWGLVSSTALEYPGLQNEPASNMGWGGRNYMNELSGFPTVHRLYF